MIRVNSHIIGRFIFSPCTKLTIMLIFGAITACGGPGGLVSNPQVSNADNNQVVVVGDSIFALSGRLQDSLESYAGETFRRYTLSGAELKGGIFATDIYSQYNLAKKHDGNIKTVLMNGAGNDILIPTITLFDPFRCRTYWFQFGRLSNKCKRFMDDLYVDAVNLLNAMSVDGVDNIVYLGYYYPKDGLLLLDNMEEAIDYGDKLLNRACEYSAASCSFIDPRSTINDTDIIFDGIHPNSEGSQKLADLVWPVLRQKL